MRSVASYLEGHARRRPVVLALSDLHWADDLVLDLIERLLERLRNLPFVLVGTARPGFEQRWALAGGHHNSLVMHIDPLDADATASLARELFGDTLTDDVLGFLLERSGGNPFFVEELVALVCEVEHSDSPVEAARLGVLPADPARIGRGAARRASGHRTLAARGLRGRRLERARRRRARAHRRRRARTTCSTPWPTATC